MSHMSGVRCSISGVACHVSNVRCHISGVACHLLLANHKSSEADFFFREGSPPPTCYVSLITCHMSHVT